MSRVFLLVVLGLSIVLVGIWFLVTREEEPSFRITPRDEEKARIARLAREVAEAPEPAVAAQQLLLRSLRESDRHYRDFRDFRHIFREHAPVGHLDLVGPGEPGDALRIEGSVTDEAGAGLSGALVYCFQTDAGGSYHPGESSAEGIARLFGYVRTDDDGRFEVRTVRPGNYAHAPRTPQHVHFAVRRDGYARGDGREGPPSLYFADDPELDAEARREIEYDGGVISTVEKGADGVLVARWRYRMREREEEAEDVERGSPVNAPGPR
ncbi:MAG: hypothetical protein R3F20_00775 [Planctomycetota bacterium]